MDNNLEEYHASIHIKDNTDGPQMKVLAHVESNIKDNSKKRRKRKRSKKQVERWIKYREQKKIEKKNHVNISVVPDTSVVADLHIPETNEAPSIAAACSTLRADVQEFVPMSLASTFDIKTPSLSINIDDQKCEKGEPEQDVADDNEDENADANETTCIIQDSRCIIADNFHIDDDDTDNIFGIMTVYATSELHAIIDKEVICKTTDAAEEYGYFYFSVSNFLKCTFEK